MPNVILQKTKSGWTPLYLAIRYNPAVLPMLFEALGSSEARQNAILQENDDSGWTSLHLAEQYNPAVLPILLKEAFLIKLINQESLTEDQMGFCACYKEVFLEGLLEYSLSQSEPEHEHKPEPESVLNLPDFNNDDSINRFIQGLLVDGRNHLCRTLQRAITPGTPLSKIFGMHRDCLGSLFSHVPETVTKIRGMILSLKRLVSAGKIEMMEICSKK